ncbi:MAG: DUF1272 domain-containing protein [Myxococcales bacterium FL481]|nr:MAG: DUF1272 domain-containing protein [Myxococcales bacterium FL481]
MLALRPNCELCDKDLPPDSLEARICSYECTFCARCVEELGNVCPNCGGGFCPRPVRPRGEYREGLGLEHHPASVPRKHSPWSPRERERFCRRVAAIPAHER